MAGFDFFVESRKNDRGFIQALLHLSQRLAERHNVRLTYRWKSNNGYQVEFNGELMAMQQFLDPLVTGLVSFAEGAVSFGPKQYRQKLARRVTSSYASGLDEITHTVEHASELLHGTPNSISFNVGKATHLSGHIAAFTNSLSLYLQNRIRAHQVAEDAHTIIELLLNDLIGSHARELSFEEKVNLAREKKFIDNESTKALIELKNLRRDSKHRGQGIHNQTMVKLLPSIIASCQRLVYFIRNRVA